MLLQLIATTPDEVGIAALDFYTIGHICMGIAIFLIFSLFYTIPMKSKGDSRVIMPLWVVWIITVACGVVWEFIENTLFIELGWKFEGRKDSLLNSVTDIIFVGVGGLGMWWLAKKLFNKGKYTFVYYFLGILGFILWIGVYIVLRSATFN